MEYTYRCDRGGEELVSPTPADRIFCVTHAAAARRVRRFGLAKVRTQRDIARWDPVVGRYVRNDREFRDALKEAQAREEAETNMECRLVPVAAADTTALNELHSMTEADRMADLEPTLRREHDKAKG